MACSRNPKADLDRLADTMFDGLSFGTRAVVGVRIHEAKGCFEPLFGDWSRFDASAAQFVPALAGYAPTSVYAGGDDVFLASDRLLVASLRDYETILLHELAHLAVAVGCQCPLLDRQKKFAIEVFGAMHPDAQQLHPIEFCESLTGAAARYATSLRVRTSETVRLALREELIMWDEVVTEP
jgi:hypothetical protein